MKHKLPCLVIALLMGLVPAICLAQDFSADVVYLAAAKAGAASEGTEASAHNPSRLFVSEENIRLETRGPAGIILLVSGGEQTAFALFPSKKEYEPLSGGLSEYFRVADAENACPDWQKASAQTIDCEKVSREVVDGRQTVKYRNKRPSDAAIAAVWIDLELKFVVKWEGASTGADLRNIQEAQQAANLFMLPSDYDIPRPRKGTNKGFSNRGP
jgi:hypothetical protein